MAKLSWRVYYTENETNFYSDCTCEDDAKIKYYNSLENPKKSNIRLVELKTIEIDKTPNS